MLTRARTALASPEALEHTLVLLAATVWLIYLTPSSGGFHDPRTAVLAAATLPAVAVTQPWRRVSLPLLLLPIAAAAGGLVVLLTSASGWMQADSVADQVLGLVVLVLVTAYARTTARRRAVASVLAVGLATTSFLAVKPWVGSGDPNTLVTAPFYWHNQTGAFVGALVLLVGSAAVLGRSRVSLLLAPVGAAVVVLTTSRTMLGLLVLGWLVVGARSFRRATLLRWLAVPLLTAGLLAVATSSFAKPWDGVPAFTGGSAAAAANTGPRGSESLESNGSNRTAWSVAALHAFGRHPVLGNGFGSFLATSDRDLAPGSDRSTFVHDGYAEALSSGGLAFGGPMLAAAVVVGLAAARQLRRRPTAAAEGPLLLGTALAAGVLLLHSAVDFDAHYASLQVLLGVLGGVLLAARSAPHLQRPHSALPVVTALGLALGLCAFTTLAEHHGRVVSLEAHTATALLDARWPGIDDPRLAEAALRACLDSGGNLAVPPDVARRAVAASKQAAGLFPAIRQLRDLVASAS